MQTKTTNWRKIYIGVLLFLLVELVVFTFISWYF